MTIVRFCDKTLTLGTLKKRAKDVLEYTFVLEKLGLANSGKALGKFTTHVDVKAHARIGEWDVWCNEDDQTIHFLRAGTDTSQDLKYYLVRTPEGFDLIPDPEIAQREQARPVVVGAKLSGETLEEAHQRVDALYVEEVSTEELDKHITQAFERVQRTEVMIVPSGTPGAHSIPTHAVTAKDAAEKMVTVVDHIEPSRTETEQRLQRIQEDAEHRVKFEARIEKAVTRTTPGRKRSVDGRIQQMLGVRSQMVGKKRSAVTNGGDPNCKRCAADPVPCKAHGGARKRKAARELQAIFC